MPMPTPKSQHDSNKGLPLTLCSPGRGSTKQLAVHKTTSQKIRRDTPTKLSKIKKKPNETTGFRVGRCLDRDNLSGLLLSVNQPQLFFRNIAQENIEQKTHPLEKKQVTFIKTLENLLCFLTQNKNYHTFSLKVNRIAKSGHGLLSPHNVRDGF